MKKIVIIVAASVILGLGALAFALYSVVSWSGGENYYTCVSNENVEHNESEREGIIDFKGGLPYIYHLNSFSEKGGEKLITFGASKELREGAYIRLKFVPVRGVVSWEEVKKEDIPENVWKNFDNK